MAEVGVSEDLEAALEKHRRELTAYCYRMLGSAFDAEDAVQETMVRAWRSYDRFEGRSSLRSWLYRIATNVCYDQLNGKQRRARPMDLGPSSTADTALGAPLGEATWLQPMPDARIVATDGDPAEVAEARESVRLAFVAALGHLPPRQRAVLILCEVLRWKAEEAAELLETSVASVNSALQRARATLAAHDVTPTATVGTMDEQQQELVTRYAEAFQAYDMESLVALLHDDVNMSMPPFDLWLQGPDQVEGWMLGTGSVCRNSRLVPTVANGSPAFGHYHTGDDGVMRPWSLLVLEIAGDKIAGINHFLDAEQLFPLFGLPLTLADDVA
jgi:RNA polymerase sigma-70 factor (ECF subfamily)